MDLTPHQDKGKEEEQGPHKDKAEDMDEDVDTDLPERLDREEEEDKETTARNRAALVWRLSPQKHPTLKKKRKGKRHLNKQPRNIRQDRHPP